jgi:hypothetical protein
MTDFFDDLERQLVEAANERPRRVGRARARHGAVLATVLLGVLAGGAGLATALSGSATDGGPTRPAAPTATASQTVTVSPRTGRVAAGGSTVAVLNGTAVPGLARGVANRLQNSGFKIGNVTNAADRSRFATLVQYAPGREAQARAVARALAVGGAFVRPADAGSRAIAGAQASVVVVVGSDQNTSPDRKTSRTP